MLVVDECRATGGGIADAVVVSPAESGGGGGRMGTGVPVGSVRSADSYVPLGPAADAVLLSERDVLMAARRMTARAGG